MNASPEQPGNAPAIPRHRQATVLSRHTFAARHRFNVEAQHLGDGCTISGNPLTGKLILRPNRSGQVASATFRANEILPNIDAFSFYMTASRNAANPIKVSITVTDPQNHQEMVIRRTLASGESQAASVCLDALVGDGLSITYAVESAEPGVDGTLGTVHFTYCVGYRQNPLINLFNAVDSDKGTVTSADRTPHCYAMLYYRLLKHLRQEQFNFLEIGLDNASKETGKATNAPSLNVWRAFFRHARLYGFDINDFRFLKGPRTVTFQGDQSSRDDLNRFLATNGRPQFGVILDDGSHASSHQQITLATLFPQVRPGGIYLIEDLSWQPFEESAKTVDVLRRFTETGRFQSPFVTPDEAAELERTIARVEIYKPNDSEVAVLYRNGSAPAAAGGQSA